MSLFLSIEFSRVFSYLLNGALRGSLVRLVYRHTLRPQVTYEVIPIGEDKR